MRLTTPTLLLMCTHCVCAAASSITQQYYKLPLAFERQADSLSTTFVARGNGYAIRLQKGGGAAIGIQPDPKGPASVVSMEFAGSRAVAASAGPELPGKVNYIRGNDPRQWRFGVPTYERVSYYGIYPGVDVVYYGNQQRLEFDLMIQPGTDPSRIRLMFGGAKQLHVDASGDLVIGTAAGDVQLPLPAIYQNIEGARRQVKGHYALRGKFEAGFVVENYERAAALVIDPAIVYSIRAGGGTNSTFAQAMALDSQDDVYLAGYTFASDFPTANAAFAQINLTPDGFISKLNPSGTALVYSTFIGGSNTDILQGIAVDATGAAWVTGYTFSKDFPTLNGYQATPPGTFQNAVVAKLSPSGALAYSTYFGSNLTSTIGRAIATDIAGNAYVTGWVNGAGLPVTAGVLQTTNAGGTDVLVAKFGSAGTLAYSTYLGGNSTDEGFAIAADSGGNAYITGETCSSSFVNAPAGGAQPALASCFDAFVVKLNPAASALTYFTFLGGTNFDEGSGIAVDANGNAYVAGYTFSADFPATPGALQTYLAGLSNGFVAKLNSTGSAFQYVTYLGGNVSDTLNGLAIDAAGDAYVTGYTNSVTFPLASAIEGNFPGSTATLYETTNSGGTWTPLGTTLAALVYSVSPDPSNALVFVVSTNSGTYRTTDGGQTWTKNGGGPVNAHLARSPVSANTIYAASTSNNTSYVSNDGGITWTQEANLGFQATNVIADPLNASTAYAFSFGIYQTINGGASWNPINVGLPNLAVYAMAAGSDGSLYASLSGSGVYKSANSGASWGAANTGLPLPVNNPAINGLTISPSNPNVLYWSNNSVTLYVSANGGTSWNPVPTPLPFPVNTLASQPPNATTIAAVANNAPVLYLSTDGGTTWNPIGMGLGAVPPTQVIFSPASATTMLAVTTERQAAFVSEVNPSGTALVFSTFLGGAGGTLGYGIAVDPATTDIFAAGYNGGGGFPETSTAFQGNLTNTEAFVVRISGSTPACSYSVNPLTQSISGGSQALSYTVLAPSGCAWTATSNNPGWAIVGDGATGAGWGIVTVTAAPNSTGATRSAILTIAGQESVLTQGPLSCAYSFTVNPSTIGAAGGVVQVGIATGPGCPWKFNNPLPLAASFSGSAAGTGNGTLNLTIAPNPSPTSRFLNFGFGSINQAGTCAYTLSSPSAVFGVSGGTGSVTINVPAGCAWTANSSNNAWLTITAGSSGTGSGTVYYSVAPSGQSRTATLFFNNVSSGPSFTVGQSANSQSYLISTLAGGQVLPPTALPGTSAFISNTSRVATDSSGNVYFSSGNLRMVFKLDTNGNLTRYAGNGTCCYSGDNGPATSAQLNFPQGLAVDNTGNLYIADGNNRIRKVARNGIITTVAGNGNFGFSGDNGPAISAELANAQGVAVDSNGNIYIADSGNQRVRKVAAQTGIITTFAGNGTAGYLGDTGPATSAELNNPVAVAVDSNGNVYITDNQNSAIREVVPNGNITTFAGNGTCAFTGDNGLGSSAQLCFPLDAEVDNNGNVYITDSINNRIRKVAVGTGIITTVAGNGTGGFSGDGGLATSTQLGFNPQGAGVDSNGNLYIADGSNQRIRKVAASTGIITTVAGGGLGDSGPAIFGSLNNPQATAIDNLGNLYIADSNNNRVRKVAAQTGIITTFAGNGTCGFSGDTGAATSAQLCGPNGVAVDGTGNLYIADNGNIRVRIVAAGTGTITTCAGSGFFGFSGDGGPATSAGFGNPQAVAVDGTGNLYISDGTNRVRKVTAGCGTITTVAGNGTAGFSGDNGPATSAELANPPGVAVDGTGNLYIADTFNERVRKVAAGTGTITTVAGNGICAFSGDGGPAASSQLCNPFGVAVDGTGNLYIADTFNERVRKVDTTTLITTVAGNGFYNYTGDGGPAVSASFENPRGIAVDSFGNLYVADQGDNAVRLVTPGNQPVFSIQSSHTGTMATGQTGTYTLTVTNAPGAIASSGMVTVKEIVPAFMTVTAMSGTGWNCGGTACTRSDALAAGSSYPPITATVTVGAGAPLQATNQVTVSGGGGITAGGEDFTLIVAEVAPVSVTPSSGSGTEQTFTVVYADQAGTSDITSTGLWFDSTGSTASTCIVYFNPPASLYLVPDSGSGFLGPITIGSNATLNNSQCTISAAGSSSSTSGNNLTVNFALTFAAGFAGQKNVKAIVAGNSGQSGWVILGTWLTAPITAAPVSVSPSAGSGTQQKFTLVYSDTAGASDILSTGVWFDSTGSMANTCLVYFNPPSSLYLLTDGGAFAPPAVIGSNATLSNSQCTINAAASSASSSNNSLALNLAVSFKPGFAGLKNIKMLVDGASASSPWQIMGTWTPVPIVVTPTSVTPGTSTGLQQTFAVTFSDTAGASDIISTGVWFDGTGSMLNSCVVYFNPPSSLYLVPNNGGFLGPIAIGSNSTLSNTQCTINGAGSSASASGNILTVKLAMTFAASFAGQKNTKALAVGASGQSAWAILGSWTVPGSIVVAPVLVLPSTGSGTQGAFTFTASDTAGTYDISQVWFWFDSGSGSINNTCIGYYSPSTNQLFLYKDAGPFLGPVTLGSNNTLSNSQCTINGPAASTSFAGDNLSVHLPISFTAGFSGVKTVKMLVAGFSGVQSPWTSMGTWSIPGAPPLAPQSVTPQSGSGSSQTFTFTYTDPAGATDITQAWFWFDSAAASGIANTCIGYYNPVLSTLNLFNSAGTAFLNPVTRGLAATLSNAGCGINAAATTVSLSGNTLTLNLPVSFTSSMAGLRNVKMFVAGGTGQSSWVPMGTWMVPGTITVAPVSVAPFSGIGVGQQFTLVYTDTVGAGDIASVGVWFDNGSGLMANACIVYYNPPSNRLYLVNDAGSALLVPVLLGSNNTLSNSQCTVNALGSVTISGDTLTVILPVNFTAPFTGIIHMLALGSANSGWLQIPSPPTLTSISPNTAVQKSAAVTLNATGTNFMAGASIQWTSPGGVAANLPANFISSTQLQATIPATLLTSPGTAQVAIQNPGNQVSAPQPFTITPLSAALGPLRRVPVEKPRPWALGVLGLFPLVFGVTYLVRGRPDRG